MTRIFKAALCAAALTCAGQAQAASFVRYTILTQGGGTHLTGTSPSGIKTSSLANFTFDIGVMTDGASIVVTAPNYQQIANFSPYLVGPGYLGGSGAATVDGGTLSFFQGQPFYMLTGLSLNIDACLASNSGGVFPIGNVGIVGNCGSVSYSARGKGFETDYTGVVTGIRGVVATEGTGLLAVTPGVPEPSTWALMLAGFGLAGYALRRRRVAFVCSYSPAASGCSAR